jgi:Ca2+-binding EF-hand superfamily protein
MVDRLKNFSISKKLKKATLYFIASRCNGSEINKQRKLFMDIDKNSDGYITLAELEKAT